MGLTSRFPDVLCKSQILTLEDMFMPSKIAVKLAVDSIETGQHVRPKSTEHAEKCHIC